MGKEIIFFIMVLSIPLAISAIYDDCERYGICEPSIVNINQTIISSSSGGGSPPGPHPFDQWLNTTSDVLFNTLTLTDRWLSTTGAKGLTLTEATGDLMLGADVAGANYFEIMTNGAFLQLWANPAPANGYKLFTITETQGDPTDINFYEGGTGHNRFWSSGSVRIGGEEDYLCSNLTSAVDCNTPSTGADLVVQDDVWVGGKVLANDWTNVSITESQISDLTHFTNADETDPKAYNGTLRYLSNLTFNGNSNFRGNFTLNSSQDGSMEFFEGPVLGVYTYPYMRFYNPENGDPQGSIANGLNIMAYETNFANLAFGDGHSLLLWTAGIDNITAKDFIIQQLLGTGSVIIKEDTIIDDTLDVTGNTQLDSALKVDGIANLTSTVYMKDLSFDGADVQLDGGSQFEILYHDGTDWVKLAAGNQDESLTSCPSSTTPHIAWINVGGGGICPF